MKKLFDKLKLFMDAWKIWLFAAALLGTNGLQAGLHYSSPNVKHVDINEQPKTIIIHKSDNSYCDKLINDHKNGSQH